MSYDAGDLDALADLEIHAGYRMVVERLTSELGRRQKELESDADISQTAKLRGMIQGLRIALDVRKILEGEIREELEI